MKLQIRRSGYALMVDDVATWARVSPAHEALVVINERHHLVDTDTHEQGRSSGNVNPSPAGIALGARSAGRKAGVVC
jgi:hypothetical protein